MKLVTSFTAEDDLFAAAGNATFDPVFSIQVVVIFAPSVMFAAAGQETERPSGEVCTESASGVLPSDG
jgi:hypothetical protein